MTYIKQQAFTGLSTARPQPTASGRVYYCTDMPVQYIDDPSGSGWMMFVNGTYCPAPASASSYTGVGTISLTNYADVIRSSIYANPNDTVYAALIAGSLTSTATWVVNLVASFTAQQGLQYPEFGVLVTNGTTSGTSVGYSCFLADTGAVLGQCAGTFTIGGGRISLYTGTVNQITQMIGGNGLVHLRLLNDGTNLHYQVSNDGFHWVDIWLDAAHSGLTNYGFWHGSEASASGGYSQALVYANYLTTITVPQATITAATNASPIVITTSSNHNFLSADLISINGVGGNTNANSGSGVAGGPGINQSSWTIQVLSPTTFSLIGSTGNSSYTSGGTATLVGR